MFKKASDAIVKNKNYLNLPSPIGEGVLQGRTDEANAKRSNIIPMFDLFL